MDENATMSGAAQEVVAPENENPTAAAGGEEVVTSRQGDFALVEAAEPEEAEGEPAEESEDAKDESPENADRGKQSREDNHAARAARLRAMREAQKATEEAMARRADEEIASAGVVNPYTQEPITSMREFREYAERFKRDKLSAEAAKQGKTVEQVTEDEENRKLLSDLRQGMKEQQKAQRAKEKQTAFLRDDVLNFVEKYPEFFDDKKLEALENNQSFRKFCGSRFGREPLAELYGDYLAVVGETKAAAAAQTESRKARSTGGGDGGGATLTPEQSAELRAWNEEHPEMKMTAKEFMARG